MLVEASWHRIELPNLVGGCPRGLSQTGDRTLTVPAHLHLESKRSGGEHCDAHDGDGNGEL
jgi:hypothetical protein